MLSYKQLWTVERIFRTDKHLFATRPIFHKLDGTIRGHVFCSFPALVLKIELEHRIAALGEIGLWPEILGNLDALTEATIAQDGKRFLVRSAPRPPASRCAPPASPRRRPFARSRPTERAPNVVPRRRRGTNRHP
jgi:hypothetical protein